MELGIFLGFIIGALLASNSTWVHNFFSWQELIEGISKGLDIGERIKDKKKEKK